MHRFEKWRERVARANSATEVAELMEEYVAALPHAVLETMPVECREAVKDDDLAASAVTLLRCELTYAGDDQGRQFLHEVAHTFVAAASRATIIKRQSRPAPLSPE